MKPRKVRMVTPPKIALFVLEVVLGHGGVREHVGVLVDMGVLVGMGVLVDVEACLRQDQGDLETWDQAGEFACEEVHQVLALVLARA